MLDALEQETFQREPEILPGRSSLVNVDQVNQMPPRKRRCLVEVVLPSRRRAKSPTVKVKAEPEQDVMFAYKAINVCNLKFVYEIYTTNIPLSQNPNSRKKEA